MNGSAWWPWAALVLLGAYHGLNPGMGWLFAVGRGLQEKSRDAVLGSLLPIALGHEASIVIVVVAVSVSEQVVPPSSSDSSPRSCWSRSACTSSRGRTHTRAASE